MCKGKNRTRARSYQFWYVSRGTLTSVSDRLRLTGAGWDAIFEYDGETYAEMDKAKKNMVSHRAIALSKLKQWLQAQ